MIRQEIFRLPKLDMLPSFRLVTSTLGWLLFLAPALVQAGSPALVQAGSENTGTGTGAIQSTTGSDDTADGYAALVHNTSGSFNTALGARTLVFNTTGAENTAAGVNALFENTTGFGNSAFGVNSLIFNTTGSANTALGHSALQGNTTATANTALGYEALLHDTTGYDNTASGADTLYSNTTGHENTAEGRGALFSNGTGSSNVASGYYALVDNTTGYYNTATGYEALFDNTTGSNNVALGAFAGEYITTGSLNVDIANLGSRDDSAVMRLGTQGNQKTTFIAGIYGVTASGGLAVYVNNEGQLSTQTSSARYKQDIHDMAAASRALYALRPVAFRYKPEYDKAGLAQFGLVAEEVEKVAPDLVIHDPDGRPYSVRYEQVNAMLLNEFLQEHTHAQEQAASLSRLEAAHAEQATAARAQQAVNDELRQELAAQAALLRQLSARMEGSAPAPLPAERQVE